jgi:hypothetical protein
MIGIASRAKPKPTIMYTVAATKIAIATVSSSPAVTGPVWLLAVRASQHPADLQPVAARTPVTT